MAHWLLGLNHFLLGEFGPGLVAEAHVELIGEAMGDPRLRGFAAWTSGWIYATRGDAEEGIKQCQAALAYAADPLNATAALGQLGYAYLESGDLAQAISLLEQAVQQVDRFRLRQLAGRFKTLLSEAYLLKGDLAKARELAIEGLAMTQEIKHAYVVGLAQRGLGRIDRASGAFVEAEHHLHEALQTFASIQAQFEVGRTYLDLAVAAHAREDRDTVTACLGEALHLFRTLQVPKYMERAVQMAAAGGVLLA
jgi:tetratricopeptide (TPR) repeat protein